MFQSVDQMALCPYIVKSLLKSSSPKYKLSGTRGLLTLLKNRPRLTLDLFLWKVKVCMLEHVRVYRENRLKV